MFLIRQIKVEPDEAVGILAKKNEQICVKMDLDIVTGVFVQSTFGTGHRNL